MKSLALLAVKSAVVLPVKGEERHPWSRIASITVVPKLVNYSDAPAPGSFPAAASTSEQTVS